eukprot:5876476-Pleurochrysis_carterae.AAC.2
MSATLNFDPMFVIALAGASKSIISCYKCFLECFERVSICLHKSLLPNGLVFKVTRDILDEVGNVWAMDLSPLELQNAQTKRVATPSGSRRLVLASAGFMWQPMRGKS